MSMRLAVAAAFLLASVAAGSAQAAQIALSPASVVGSSGYYNAPDPQYAPGNIFDHQTGAISEQVQANYWINPDNGPGNAYITFDLGAGYVLSSVTLFNTHNAFYNDRGTGDFTIAGSNSVAGGQLVGPTTLVRGSLAAVSQSVDPLPGQSFGVSNGGSFRYLAFLPTSVAVSGGACCGANVYGLNELRVFASDAPAVPEPASWAMMIAGVGMVGGAMRRRGAKPAFA